MQQNKSLSQTREYSVELNFMNTCTMDQLRRIAVESYKSAMNAGCLIQELQMEKVKLIDTIINNPSFGNGTNGLIMKGIEEEPMNNINQNAMDIDFEQNNDQKWEMKINEMRQEYETKLKEYNGLSMKLVQNEMKFEEKMAEFNHLRQQKKAMDEEMNGLQKQYANESMLKIVDIESKHKEQMNVLSQSYEFKLTDFEHDIKEKEKKIEQYETNKLSLECKLKSMNTKYNQLQDQMNEYEANKISMQSDNDRLRQLIKEYKQQRDDQNEQKLHIEGIEKNKEIKLNEQIDSLLQKNKQLMIENNKLKNSSSRYKAVIDERDVEIEKISHSNRDCMEKIQKQHIEIGESNESIKKLTNMTDKLKNEYLRTKDLLNEDINAQKKINDANQKEIESLNVCIEKKDKKMNALQQSYEQLTNEFVQKQKEFTNLKHQLEQKEHFKVVYEEKMIKYRQEIDAKQQLIKDAETAFAQKQTVYESNTNAQNEMITDLNYKINQITQEYDAKMIKINNEKQELCKEYELKQSEQQNCIDQKQQIIEEINIKFNSVIDEKNNLLKKLQESDDWSLKYQKLFATITQNSDREQQLRTKYECQCHQILHFKQTIDALQKNKNSLILQIESMRNEIENELKNTYQQINEKHQQILQNKCAQIQKLEENHVNYQENNNKLIASKDKQIDRWKNKYGQTDIENNALNEKYSKIYLEHQSTMNELKQLQTTLNQTHSNLEVAERELGIVENEMHQIQNELELVRKNNKISLQEADEELIREQNESRELYQNNEKLEEEIKRLKQIQIEIMNNHKNEMKELENTINSKKESMEEEIQSLYQQLESLKLKCSNAPSPVKRDSLSSNSSNSSHCSSSSSQQRIRINRKRQRDEMESDQNESINGTNCNPIKKRKITITGNVLEIEENDENDIDRDTNMTPVYEEKETVNINISLPPTPMPITPITNKEKKRYSNLISPALSHLSEGDDPLPKIGNCRTRKAIKKSNKPKLTYNKKIKKKKYPLMRTPAIKEEKTRRFTQRQFDLSQPTPTTKSGLNQLRVVDLKKKLKKHSLKAYGKKAELVNTLYAHKNKMYECDDDNDDNDDVSNNNVGFKWIGDSIKECDGKTYYDGIKIDGFLYKIGQECHVKNEDDNGIVTELWMSQIVELYEKENEFFMANIWFWKYGEIRKALKKSNHDLIEDENELFLSSGHEPDENHIALLEPATFKVFDSKKKMNEYQQQHNDDDDKKAYFSQYSFDLKNKKLHSRLHDLKEEESQDFDSENENKLKKKEKKLRAKSSASTSEYDGKVKGRRRGKRKRNKSGR